MLSQDVAPEEEIKIKEIEEIVETTGVVSEEENKLMKKGHTRAAVDEKKRPKKRI